jgi:hypothetical protein
MHPVDCPSLEHDWLMFTENMYDRVWTESGLLFLDGPDDLADF